jgi:hypothetical protein
MSKRRHYRQVLNMSRCVMFGVQCFDICSFMPEHSGVASCLTASQPIRKSLISIYANSVCDTYVNKGFN